MKKKLIIFLGIFIFMIIPKNAYALSSNSDVVEFLINNTNFVNSQATLTYSNTNTFQLTVEVNTLYPYKYYAIYFQSPISISNLNSAFGVSLTGGCSTSCFGSNYYVKPVGRRYYAIVLPSGKLNCGVGSGQCLIDNILYLFSASNTDVKIVGVDAFDDDNILTNSFADFYNIIENQNSNTNSIISNVQNFFNNSIATLNQSIYDTQSQTNTKLNNINNSINDDSTDNTYQNSTLDNLNSQLASNNVISDLLLLPVNMYQKILNSVNGTCSSFNIGSLYGTTLTMPCIQPQNYIGSSLWGVIDILFCGFFILAIRKKFVDVFNNMTNLKDRGNDIE